MLLPPKFAQDHLYWEKGEAFPLTTHFPWLSPLTIKITYSCWILRFPHCPHVRRLFTIKWVVGIKQKNSHWARKPAAYWGWLCALHCGFRGLRPAEIRQLLLPMPTKDASGFGRVWTSLGLVPILSLHFYLHFYYTVSSLRSGASLSSTPLPMAW